MTIIYHPRYMDHVQNRFHPESPERLKAIRARLEKEGLWNDVLEPEGPAAKEDVTSVHTDAYYGYLENIGEGYVDTGDTMMHDETFGIAMLAVAGGLLAARTARDTGGPNFALLRPPGHHATADRAMGFCYLNNIAIAAQRLLDNGMKRIAIVDTDLHHGNGTHDIFYDRKDVLYISTHQWGNFPGTGSHDIVGSGEGAGYTVNIPFVSGCGDGSFDQAFDRVVCPIIRQYKPDMVLVSVGGDAHFKDPLGGLTPSSTGMVRCHEKLLALARELCGGRISFFLEGGYNMDALADVVAGTISAFETGKHSIGLMFPEGTDDIRRGKDIVDKVVEAHSRYWRL